MAFWYKNRRNYYFKYATYANLSEAMKIARRYKKRGAKYKIIENYFGNKKAFSLYLTKVVSY